MKPSIPIIDAHVPLWHPEQIHISWLDENVFLNHPYLLDLYEEPTKDLPIEALIFMECGLKRTTRF